MQRSKLELMYLTRFSQANLRRCSQLASNLAPFKLADNPEDVFVLRWRNAPALATISHNPSRIHGLNQRRVYRATMSAQVVIQQMNEMERPRRGQVVAAGDGNGQSVDKVNRCMWIRTLAVPRPSVIAYQGLLVRMRRRHPGLVEAKLEGCVVAEDSQDRPDAL